MVGVLSSLFSPPLFGISLPLRPPFSLRFSLSQELRLLWTDSSYRPLQTCSKRTSLEPRPPTLARSRSLLPVCIPFAARPQSSGFVTLHPLTSFFFTFPRDTTQGILHDFLPFSCPQRDFYTSCADCYFLFVQFFSEDTMDESFPSTATPRSLSDFLLYFYVPIGPLSNLLPPVVLSYLSRVISLQMLYFTAGLRYRTFLFSQSDPPAFLSTSATEPL